MFNLSSQNIETEFSACLKYPDGLILEPYDDISGDDFHAGVLRRVAKLVELPGVREQSIHPLPSRRHRHVLLHRHLSVQEEPHH